MYDTSVPSSSSLSFACSTRQSLPAIIDSLWSVPAQGRDCVRPSAHIRGVSKPRTSHLELLEVGGVCSIPRRPRMPASAAVLRNLTTRQDLNYPSEAEVSAALPHAATAPHPHTLQPASKYLQRGAFDSIDASDTKNSAWPRAEDACITVIICIASRTINARCRPRCRVPAF
mgnify:CR=1 FL=1